MASSSFLCLGLCFLVLFHCSLAKIDLVTSRSSNGTPERQQRSQQFECNFERIKAQEPHREIRLEAGTTHIWNENDEQFRCAGVVTLRHTIHQRGLLLPAYSNVPRLIYVEQGRGLHGAVITGCPETIQSSGAQSSYSDERGQSPRDEHQKVRRIREGDIIALPTGVSDWVHNDGDTNLVLVVLMDSASAINQLDQDFRVRRIKYTGKKGTLFTPFQSRPEERV